MRNVEEMTIEECVYEVFPGATLGLLITSMDGADVAIRDVGWRWGKMFNCWGVMKGDEPRKLEPDADYLFSGDEKDVFEIAETTHPALDLWRLAVLVYRSKDPK